MEAGGRGGRSRGDARRRAEARGWKTEVTDALTVTFTIYVPRPKGHYGKKGLLPSARPHPSVKPDCLKLARGLEDSLSGIVWKDDAQIVDEHIVKTYGEPARCEITVAVVGSLPPFSPQPETRTP